MIQISDVHKKFGKNEVLKGLDLSIGKGGIIAILGPNGSGKTTLIKSILGMVLVNRGKISVMDRSVKTHWDYRKEINYLPQIANFPGNLKVKELMEMIMDLRQKPANATELIDRFGLKPHLDKKLCNLSGGKKQKVNLVLAFMFDSPFLILDEPTTGLDPAALIQLKKLLNREREKGKTILISSHILQFVEEIADEIVYLLEGKIYFKGPIKALKEKTGQNDFEHAIAAIAPQEDHD